jgi:2-polyprenyl-3-methyl-5-hydroxy-6-metoxy-1,4-benzoquinol methylase
MSDLTPLVRGLTVLDIGCDRGLVSLMFALNGAKLVHGCDKYEKGVEAAREVFAETRVPSRFETVDLTGGMPALSAAFGADLLHRYDVVLFLSMYHILRMQQPKDQVLDLVQQLIDRTGRYFVYRKAVDLRDHEFLDDLVARSGLIEVHYSWISRKVGPLLVYERQQG